MVRKTSLASVVALVLASSAAAGVGEPKHHFRASDLALARSIGLKSSDFPHGLEEASRDPNQPLSSGPRCGGKPDESDLTLTGEAVSHHFSPPGSDYAPEFSWGAFVFLTAAQAEAAFRRQMQLPLARCVVKATISWAAKGEIPLKLTLVSQSLGPLAGLGLQARALRLLLRIEDSPLLIAEDLFVIRKGRVEAWLVASFGVHLPARFAVEEPLLAKLVARLLRADPSNRAPAPRLDGRYDNRQRFPSMWSLRPLQTGRVMARGRQGQLSAAVELSLCPWSRFAIERQTLLEA